MTVMNFKRTYENGNVCEAHVYVYVSGNVSYNIEAPFDFYADTLDDAIDAIKRHGFDVSTCTCEVF